MGYVGLWNWSMERKKKNKFDFAELKNTIGGNEKDVRLFSSAYSPLGGDEKSESRKASTLPPSSLTSLGGFYLQILRNMVEIIRIPTKFHKSIARLPDNEKAYILTGIFALSMDEEFVVRDDGLGDLLELIHFENIKMWERAVAKKWIQKEEPKQESKIDKKPTEKQKKKKEEEKQEEIQYDTFNLHNDYLEAKDTPEDERTTTEVVLVYFYELWYKAEPNETLDTFRDWLIWISKKKNKTHEEIKEIAESWFKYWKEKWEKIEDFKSCFLGHYGFKSAK